MESSESPSDEFFRILTTMSIDEFDIIDPLVMEYCQMTAE